MLDRRFAVRFVGALLFVAALVPIAWADEAAAARSNRITAKMQEFVDAQQSAGVVALVVHDGRVVHQSAVGLSEVENKTPMRPDTLFSIASMTKPITAAAVMVLVDEGKVRLDDPVAKYIPEFKNTKLKSGESPKQEITVRHVLTHTSGLAGDQANVGSLKETCEALARRPLEFEPGTKWQYSPGLSVGGRVVEVASGQAFDAFLEQRFFRPLKMTETTFNPSPAQSARLAVVYQPGPDKKSLRRAPQSWINDVSKPRTPNPSGGLFSTAADLSRFYLMMLNEGELDGQRVLSKAAVAELIRPQTGDLKTGFVPGSAWGLGFCVVTEPQGATAMLSRGSYGHGGAFGTQGWLDPAKKMAFVLLIQRSGFGNGDGADIRRDFQATAVEAFSGK